MATEQAPRDDWAAQLTEKVGQVVELIRDRTVRPVQKFVRAAIFGVLAVFVVIFVLVALVIGLVRLLNNEVFDQRVSASYLLVGGIFVVVRDVYLEDAPQPELAGRHKEKAAQMGCGATREVVILGSGPTGLTAAIYHGQRRTSPLVLEGEPSSSDQPGGQLMLTTEVENFPASPTECRPRADGLDALPGRALWSRDRDREGVTGRPQPIANRHLGR